MSLDSRPGYHGATFGRGDCFGEMSFLNNVPRSANAVADSDTELYILSRARFDALAEERKRLALNLLEGIAIASRLRRTDVELRFLKES